MRAVLIAAWAAIARRRLQGVIVGFVVLLSSATAVLATGLLVVSHGPFDNAFAAADGAHVTATISRDVSAADLTATVPGVSAVAGPFDLVTAGIATPTGLRLGEIVVVGRASPDGQVDQITLTQGGWVTGPGQVVLSPPLAGPFDVVGSEYTVGGIKLRVVGIASSVTGTADAWVWPSQSDLLDSGEGEATGASQQMLYRFAAADTTDELAAGVAAIEAELPDGAITATTNYLAVRLAINRSISAFVPFVVAFAVLGLVLSVLITVNVVNGAVGSGFRTIGVLKTLGYTPAQVIAVYIAQVVGPAIVGAVVGVPLGVALAIPLLADTEAAYGLPGGGTGVPLWITVAVLIAAPVLVALAALGPASRAGRLAANQAINLGRAPRPGRAMGLRRALAASRLSRPVALGLGLPLARPSRTAGTVVALLLGAVTLVFAVGLSASLGRVHAAFTRADAAPVWVDIAPKGTPVGPGPVVRGSGGQGPAGQGPAVSGSALPDQDAVAAELAARSGTARSVMVRTGSLRAAGVTEEITVEGFVGDGTWVGYRMVSGRWYSSADEVVASSFLLHQTGLRVGDRLVVGDGRTLTIVGELLDGGDDPTVIGDASLVPEPRRVHVEIALTPGTDPAAYVDAVQATYANTAGVRVINRATDGGGDTFVILDALIATLTVLLCTVAALGVLNTVVLTTRERSHDIGVLKALGMTPRQTRTMVITSMVGLGLVAGLIAVPAGVALQRLVLPVMADSAGITLPASIVDVYQAWQLALLGAAGIVLAVVGALLPAGWAARARVATALRAE